MPNLSVIGRDRVVAGNMFVDITLMLAALLAAQGCDWSIENPASSMLWIMPQVISFLSQWLGQMFILDLCAFGSKHKSYSVLLVHVKTQ